MHPTASLVVLLGIGGISLLVVGGLVAGVAHVDRRMAGRFAVAMTVWVALTFSLALAGVLTRWTLPPPLMVLAVTALAGAAWIARSRIGASLAAGLPLVAIVGFQAFRLPLELVMHAAAVEGTMPEQMTFGAGYNYDIVSGGTAVVVALLAWRDMASRRLLRAWNVVGLSLLFVIIGIAIVSTPVFGLFGPERLNTWVGYAPFVWMVTINVPAALLGHLVLLRRLRDEPVRLPV